MSNPVTPTDDLLAKLAQGDEYLLIALRDLFDQAGTITPIIIEETIIAVDNANTAANQANSSVNRLAAAIEAITLAPKDIIESDNGELLPVALSDKPQDDLTPPSTRIASPDDLTPPNVGEQIADDLSPPPSADLDVYIINGLTSDELQQLQNINDVTISNAQWVFLGDFNQALTTTSNVSFGTLALSGNFSIETASNPTIEIFDTALGVAASERGLTFIKSFGQDTAGAKKQFGQLDIASADATAGSEDGVINYRVVIAGVLTTVMNIRTATLETILRLRVTDTTDSTSSTSNASARFFGGLSVAKNADIGGDLTIEGATTTAGETALLLFDVDNNTVERVTVGAADSGGTNFKVLRIPN